MPIESRTVGDCLYLCFREDSGTHLALPPLTPLTIFADDVIAQWCIADRTDLQDCFAQLTRIVHVLCAHGMDVSPQKSVILYHLHGPQAERILTAATRTKVLPTFVLPLALHSRLCNATSI